MLLTAASEIASGNPRAAAPSSGIDPASGSVTITQFSFEPSSVSSGQQVSGTVDLSGGTPPYYLWFNNTPPGCAPSNNPETTSSPTLTFQCSPSSTGSYSVHLDVVDSSTPPTKASQMAGFSVVTSNGDNSNNSNNGNNSLGSLIPSGFLSIAIILVLVLMGAIIATAVAVVALAVLVPRRLRQLNETLAKAGLSPKEPKPPT